MQQALSRKNEDPTKYGRGTSPDKPIAFPKVATIESDVFGVWRGNTTTSNFEKQTLKQATWESL